MKRLFAMLTLVAILLTGCAVPNDVTDDQTSNIEQAQTAATPDKRANRRKKDDASEIITHFELNETFQSLLDEVNAEHEAIKLYAGEYEKYFVLNKEPGFDFSQYRRATSLLTGGSSTASSNTSEVLTLEQAKSDLEIYYKALRTQYGAYEYFGGDEVFRPAIDAVIADCAGMEKITLAAMCRSLNQHLSAFVKDMHFSIGNMSLDVDRTVPFFFRDVAYVKTDTGYETLDGRQVASVDGYEDLSEVFRRSLTTAGELVYYPILLEEYPYMQLYIGEVQCSTPVLTVRYTDGSWDELYAEPYSWPRTQGSEPYIEVLDEGNVSIIDMDAMTIMDSWNVSSTAHNYRDRDILMVDLRGCMGGISSIAESWFITYTQRAIWTNGLFLPGGDKLQPQYESYRNRPDEEFVASDSVLILLADKATVSSGEYFVDMAHNLENTLIVGENTAGCLTSSHEMMQLPNSGLVMHFGSSLFLFPDGYFEEYRGFYPDIWVPQAEAEEAVMNFIAKNTTVTHEQTEK